MIFSQKYWSLRKSFVFDLRAYDVLPPEQYWLQKLLRKRLTPSSSNDRMNNPRSHYTFAHDQWIDNDTHRREHRLERIFVLAVVSRVNWYTGSCKSIRLRPKQTIEWDNFAWARELRMFGRTKTKRKYHSATHAHSSGARLILSFVCLLWTESAAFVATGVWSHQRIEESKQIFALIDVSRCKESASIWALVMRRNKNIC